MKKVAILLVLCMLIVMSAGCAARSSESTNNTTTTSATTLASSTTAKKLVIGVTNMTMKESVYKFMQESAQKKADELGVTLIWQSSENDPQVQMGQVENFIAQGVDALVIEPARSDAAASMVKLAKNANIPVVNLEALIIGESTDLRIVTNNIDVGAKMVQDFVNNEWDKGPANVVVLSGTKGDQIAEDTTTGILNELKKYPEIKIVMHQYHENWDRALAMNSMQDALVKYNKDIKAVFANNDTMAHGAMKAAEMAGVKDKMVYYGADHDKDSVEAIMAGLPLKVLDKGAILQGQRIIEAAVKLANGEEPSFDEVVNGQKVWYTPSNWVAEGSLELSKEKFPELFNK